jgi:N-acetylmuramic acid 6-phosphate (MurNAc-6-P) etherase
MGAASLQVQVPPGVEARFATSGLLSVSGRTETPGFATARDRVLVTVTGGAASLTIA